MRSTICVLFNHAATIGGKWLLEEMQFLVSASSFCNKQAGLEQHRGYAKDREKKSVNEI